MTGMYKTYRTDGECIYEDGKKISLREVVKMLNKHSKKEWERYVNSGW